MAITMKCCECGECVVKRYDPEMWDLDFGPMDDEGGCYECDAVTVWLEVSREENNND